MKCGKNPFARCSDCNANKGLREPKSAVAITTLFATGNEA